MATLKFDRKIETVKLITASGTTYYHPYPFDIEPWEKLKIILSRFDIIFSSPYELEFVDDEYRIQPVPGYFGANGGKVLYKDKVIAKDSVDGCNYCDREGNLTIYMDVLQSIYEAK